MAQDFIAILAGPPQLAAVLLSSADSSLTEAGFTRASIVHREDLEGELSPAEADVQIKLASSVREATAQLLRWNAASLEFRNDALSFQVIVARWRAGFSNTYVRVDLRNLGRLSRAGRLQVFYECLAAVAGATGATAGIGAVEPELGPLSPPDARSALALRLLSLVPASAFSMAEIAKLAEPEFQAYEIGAYWILADREYFEILANTQD
jgi:hypothetical protein